MYSYSFESKSWGAWGGNSNTNATNVPLNRQRFTATYDNGTSVYIYGGSLNNTAIFGDFYKLDTGKMEFTALPNPGQPRYGHTASMLSNGKIVVIGGVALDQNNVADLVPMQQVLVFDTQSNTWTAQNTQPSGGSFPSTRTDHSAVVTSDDKIVIFGGDSGSDMRHRQYLNAIAVLDTKTWTWEIPTVDGIPPSRRSFAVSGRFDDQHVMFAFGSALNTQYNDLNVFNLADSKWLQSFDESDNDSGSGVSGGLIAGVTIAAVVLLCIILFLLWRFQSYIRWLALRIHHDIWKPRTGEPVWAETSRIVCQIFMLFLFVCFLVFVIRQAINSPNVTQRIEEAAAQVDVPDVRFCFDGFPTYGNNDPRDPGVVCQTDTGYSCSGSIQPLDMSVFTPSFASNLGAVSCYLFRADADFKMTSTSGANNGSRMLFTFFGDQSVNYGRVHVSLYPKEMDPNVKVYNLNDDIPVIMSDFDVLTWQVNERNDLGTTNIFEVEPYSYNALSYNLIDHRYMQPVGWNYVGFSPITNSTPEVESNFRAEAPNPNYTQTHADLAFIAIYPESFANYTDREVKMYTLLNALGFVGGIFGLLVAVQTWLFGFRPSSPWGLVHRWSVGEMRRSLLRGLQTSFKPTDSSIPLVHPLHPRFSMNNMPQDLAYESEGQRISRVEERMQMMEMLFKSYYVNDEIFRSLDNATKSVPPGSTAGSPNGPLFPSEKGADVQRSNTGGFSHMFNHRQSVASTSSDAHSQQNLNTSGRL
ncbi:galactose oxidase [Lichtheimia hyalospora FSU 10163]|nr:galactose oxidase [Lichtheimia hyalospora FSU 10163]